MAEKEAIERAIQVIDRILGYEDKVVRNERILVLHGLLIETENELRNLSNVLGVDHGTSNRRTR